MREIIKPSKLKIENFRNFRDVTIELGDKFTVISGQNGVGKSNILSLIASGSGINKKSVLGSSFQPEFYQFFNIDEDEDYENYKLFLEYTDQDGNIALVKRLAFRNDLNERRRIRTVPRTAKFLQDQTLNEAEQEAKSKYGVGGNARVKIPTIFLSLSRLYPLGEHSASVKVTDINKRNFLYQEKADEKFRKWYNAVIPNAIKEGAPLNIIEKSACPRSSLHMKMETIPTLSQSIGQDNLGNIISALVDIYILSLGDDYSSALLCIDEIDVSLHPDAQIRLLDLLVKLSDELHIQFIVSTHSLTVIKNMLKREARNESDYKVTYLKDPAAPYVENIKTYELLEADMFGELSLNMPLVKIYFEDDVGKRLFEILMQSFKKLFSKVKNNPEEPVFRNASEVNDYKEINNSILKLEDMVTYDEKMNLIPVELSCEELINISEADEYFKRVIFVLDGDARYKKENFKPAIRDYIDRKYNPNDFGLSDRSVKYNFVFFPNYFAPESYLYSIIMNITNNANDHMEFWRMLDLREETALYTSEKIKQQFNSLIGNYTNDDLKEIFKNYGESEIWNFIQKSDIVSYYYSDYTEVDELIHFVSDINKAYEITYPIVVSNRYT